MRPIYPLKESKERKVTLKLGLEKGLDILQTSGREKESRQRDRQKKEKKTKNTYVWSISVSGEERVPSREEGLYVLQTADLELLGVTVNHLLPEQ